MVAQKGTSEVRKTKNKNVKTVSRRRKNGGICCRKSTKMSTLTMLSLGIGALLLVLGIAGAVLGAPLDDNLHLL